MTVNTTTVYDEKSLLAFQWHTIKSKKVFWAIMGLYNIALITILILALIKDALSSTFIACACIIFALDIIMIYMYVIIPRFSVKKSKGIGISIEYTFEEKGFKFTSKGDHWNETSEAKYSMLRKAVKTKNYLYLFVNRVNALIVDTASLSSSELDFIKNSITDSIGDKRVKWK